LMLLTSSFALAGGGAAPAGDAVRTDGSDVGITIMGAIVQKSSDDNVALIKESSGSVKAVKKDHVIADKYKVVSVHAEYIELVTRDAKRYFVYKDKFAGALQAKTVAKNDGVGGMA